MNYKNIDRSVASSTRTVTTQTILAHKIAQNNFMNKIGSTNIGNLAINWLPPVNDENLDPNLRDPYMQDTIIKYVQNNRSKWKVAQRDKNSLYSPVLYLKPGKSYIIQVQGSTYYEYGFNIFVHYLKSPSFELDRSQFTDYTFFTVEENDPYLDETGSLPIVLEVYGISGHLITPLVNPDNLSDNNYFAGATQNFSVPTVYFVESDKPLFIGANGYFEDNVTLLTENIKAQ